MKTQLLTLTLLTVTSITTPAQPPGKHWEAVAYKESSNELAVFSGAEFKDNKMQLTDSVWLYNGQWKVVDDNSIQGRWAHGLVYHNNSLYTYGGLVMDQQQQERTLNDLQVFNGSWKKLTTGPTLSLPRLFSSNGKLLLAGQLQDSLNIVEVWQWNGNSLEKILSTDLHVKPDGLRSLLVKDDVVVLYPSATGFALNNLHKKEVTEIKNMPPLSKFGVTYSPAHDSYFLFGGVNEHDEFSNELWVIKNGKAEKIMNENAPSPRASCHLVVTSRGFILFGGVEKGGHLSNKIWRYEDNKWSSW